MTLAQWAVTAIGGAGGCRGGGAGGAGRIRIDHQTLNGDSFPNTSPSITNPSAFLAPYP